MIDALIGLTTLVVSGAVFMSGITNHDANLIIASGAFCIASALWLKGGRSDG